MSTNINITVGGNSLVDQAKAQQQAARNAKLLKDNQSRVEAKAKATRDSALAAQNLNPDGTPKFGAPPRPAFSRDEPAANRREQTGSMLLYYKNGYVLRDITGRGQGFAAAPIIINRKTSAYNFINYPPLSESNGFTFFPDGGPYNQSYVQANPPGGSMRIWQAQPYFDLPELDDLYVPVLEIEKKFAGYTAEFDFVASSEWTSIYIEIMKYYPSADFGVLINGSLFRTSRVAIALSPSSGPNLPSITFYFGQNQQDFVYLNNLPIYLNAWNRLAFTATNDTMSAFLNGILIATYSVPNISYPAVNSIWPQAPESYVYLKTEFLSSGDSNSAVSAARLTSKILYTQNYTPQRIT